MNYKIITFATLLCCGNLLPAMAQNSKQSIKLSIKQSKDSKQQVITMSQTANGMLLQTTGGYLRLEIMRKNVLHVSYGNLDAINRFKSYIVKTSAEAVPHEVSDKDNQYILTASNFKATVNKATGHITIYDGTGKSSFQNTQPRLT